MNVLIKLLGILAVVNARQIEVNLKSNENGPNDQAAYCATSTGAVEKDGGACKVLMDEDNQKTTTFDYISASSVKQPTQILSDNNGGYTSECGTDGRNSPRCLMYEVKLTDSSIYSHCSVVVKGLTGSDGNSKVLLVKDSNIADWNDQTEQVQDEVKFTHTTGVTTCSFIPRNQMFLGNVEYHITFTKAGVAPQGEVQHVTVKIDAVFVPATVTLFPDATDHDGSVTQQHKQFLLLGQSNVNNKGDTDMCQAIDGIDYPKIHKSGLNVVDGSVDACECTGNNCGGNSVTRITNANNNEIKMDCSPNTRSTGSGCVRTASESFLVSRSVDVNENNVYNKIAAKDVANILVADGVGIDMRVKAHFRDVRYKVIDQTGVETLADNIGDFTIKTQGLNIDALYYRFGGTRADVTTQTSLQKLNYDDYPFGVACSKRGNKTASTGDLVVSGVVQDQAAVEDCTETLESNSANGMEAMYYLDVDHRIVYNDIKHVQPSYLEGVGTCDTCMNSLIVSGFSDQVSVKIPVDTGDDSIDTVDNNKTVYDGHLPKSDWNIYVPKLDVTVKDVAKVEDDANHKDMRPLYGLPVLQTSDSPLHPDGIPLSYLFDIKLRSSDLTDATTISNSFDIVDSYDDGYELFTHMAIRESQTDDVVEWYLGMDGTQIECSSNRINANTPGSYGFGMVRDLGNEAAIEAQAQIYFDNCRLQIAKNTTFDQILISWNEVHDSRCCQSDLEVEEHHIPNGFTATKCANGLQSVCTSRQKNNNVERFLSEPFAKLTIMENRKVMIGTTELSLLRRQEIFDGHGVSVSGANIGFLFSKQNGDETSNGAVEFDIYGTQSMVGYDENANPCTSVSGNCQEVHGCSMNGDIFAKNPNSEQCSEKYVVSSHKDNEYVLHHIRSSSQCNGRLDIQLRDRETNSTNLLMDGPASNGEIFRYVYDVRLPCSRVTAKTSDSLKLTFKFSVGYSLSTNQYTFTANGNDDSALVADSPGTGWSRSSAQGTTSGFTNSYRFDAHLGTCESKNSKGSEMLIINVPSDCGVNFAPTSNNGEIQKVEDATDCYKLTDTDSDSASIEATIHMALIYHRAYKYLVDRDHALDTSIVGTEYDEDYYHCQDQTFQISVMRNKQASVRVTTPVQIIVERKAEISQISWEECAGVNMFQLRVQVELAQQNVQSSNDDDANDWHPLTDDFTATLIDGTELSITADATASHVVMTSECIQVTSDDCTSGLESPWSLLKQTSTEFLISDKDDWLPAALQTGIDIVSNVVVDTDFEACPVEAEIEESGELSVALSFELADMNDCLTPEADRTHTATYINGTDIDNCGAALVTKTGYANLHSYITENGVKTYQHGALATSSVGTYYIESQSWSFKRFEPGFGGTELGPQVGNTESICKADNSVSSVPGSDVNDMQTTLLDYGCSIPFIKLGEANALNDMFEVSVDVLMASNSARRRLLRKTIRLKAGELHSSVGFKVVSETTTVTDEEAASSLPEPVEPAEPEKHEDDEEHDEKHKKDDERHTLLVVLISVISAVVAVVLFVLCRNAKAQQGDSVSDLVSQSVSTSVKYKKVDVQEKFDNLRY